ncbi:MAG TPA: hypothetical protein VGM19_11525 [Armatimonadota bacterium]|jgi:hypothetical protein
MMAASGVAMAAGTLAVLLGVAAGAVNLRRRGGARRAEGGLALVGALQVLAWPGATGEGEGWRWLLASGATLALAYLLWQSGNLARARADGRARLGRERAGLRELPRRNEGQQVRAVASWPGRRRG